MDFVPSQKISVFTAAVGADFAVFDGGILFFTILAIGNGRNGFHFHFTTFEKVGAVGVPIPAIYELVVDDGGNLADLHDDLCNFGRVVLASDVAHDVRDVKNHS